MTLAAPALSRALPATVPPGPWGPMLARIASEVAPCAEALVLCGRPYPWPGRAGGADALWRRACLTHALYLRYYHRRERDPLPDNPFGSLAVSDRRPASAQEDPALVGPLRAALGIRWTWSPGWVAAETPDGLVARRDGLELAVTADEVRPAVDGTFEVRFPAEKRYASPGFLAVTGEAGAAEGRLVRCYLNLRRDRGPVLYADLVRDLDVHGLPFSAKIGNHAEVFERPDAGVLYVHRDHTQTALRVIDRALGSHPAGLAPEVPAFTLRVRPGVGLADEPADAAASVSFGQHRCDAVARGLLRTDGLDAQARLDAVVAELEAAGVAPERLHLDPGSSVVMPGPIS